MKPDTQEKEHPTLHQRMSLMKGWTAEILINAPQQVVWEQVTDFEAYPDWNPFVPEAHAEFTVGKKIRFLEDLKQFGQHWLEAEFLSIYSPNNFVWQGYLGAPFLFTVRHSFVFEAISEQQTRFRQIHENAGLLIPYLAWRGVYCVSHQGYLDYNQALKDQCENSAVSLL
ncbi:MAG: SRPBCC domain-containing protein [Phormidesmis sp.]